MAREGETGQVSWNIAASQSQYVFELIKKAMNYYQAGNLSRWYWTLSSLREVINPFLKKPERERLDTVEKNVQISLKYWSKYKQQVESNAEFIPAKDDLIKKNKFSVYVRVYQREIMDLLNNLGYFPSKKDRTEVNF